MRLNEIIDTVSDLLGGNKQEPEQEQGRRGTVHDPWAAGGQPGTEVGTFNGQPVYSSSQDPYGDPADQFNGQQVLPASQDPYGDPADQFNGQQVLPASQDPYGDPADEEDAQPARRGRWPF